KRALVDSDLYVPIANDLISAVERNIEVIRTSPDISRTALEDRLSDLRDIVCHACDFTSQTFTAESSHALIEGHGGMALISLAIAKLAQGASRQGARATANLGAWMIEDGVKTLSRSLA